MKAITGDFAKLQRLSQRLGDTAQMREQLSAGLGDGIGASYVRQFDQGTSSTGAPWKTNRRGTRPLVASGNLRADLRVRVMLGHGGAIAEARARPMPRYAVFYGRDPRRVLPTSESELGFWAERIQRDAESAFRRWLGGLVG